MNKKICAIAVSVLCLISAVGIIFNSRLSLIPCILSIAVAWVWYYNEKLAEEKQRKKHNNKLKDLESKLENSENEAKRYMSELYKLRKLNEKKNEEPVYIPPEPAKEIVSNEHNITERFNVALEKGGNSLFRFISSGIRLRKKGTDWEPDTSGWLTGIDDNGTIYAYPATDTMSGEILKDSGLLDVFSANRTSFEDRAQVKIIRVTEAACFESAGNRLNLKKKGKIIFQ